MIKYSIVVILLFLTTACSTHQYQEPSLLMPTIDESTSYLDLFDPEREFNHISYVSCNKENSSYYNCQTGTLTSDSLLFTIIDQDNSKLVVGVEKQVVTVYFDENTPLHVIDFSNTNTKTIETEDIYIDFLIL